MRDVSRRYWRISEASTYYLLISCLQNKSEVVGDSYVGFDETHLHPSWDDTLRNPRRPSQSQAYTSTAFHFRGQGTCVRSMIVSGSMLIRRSTREIVLQMPKVYLFI